MNPAARTEPTGGLAERLRWRTPRLQGVESLLSAASARSTIGHAAAGALGLHAVLSERLRPRSATPRPVLGPLPAGPAPELTGGPARVPIGGPPLPQLTSLPGSAAAAAVATAAAVAAVAAVATRAAGAQHRWPMLRSPAAPDSGPGAPAELAGSIWPVDSVTVAGARPLGPGGLTAGQAWSQRDRAGRRWPARNASVSATASPLALVTARADLAEPDQPGWVADPARAALAADQVWPDLAAGHARPAAMSRQAWPDVVAPEPVSSLLDAAAGPVVLAGLRVRPARPPGLPGPALEGRVTERAAGSDQHDSHPRSEPAWPPRDPADRTPAATAPVGQRRGDVDAVAARVVRSLLRHQRLEQERKGWS